MSIGARAGLLLTVLWAAACGSGESILTAGNDAPQPTASAGPPGATLPSTIPSSVPGGVAAPGGSNPPGVTAAPATVAPGATTAPGVTETAPPTTATPLADLPACNVELAPDGDPIDILFWHGLNALNDETLQAITADYNASQSRVRVQIENQGSYDEAIAKYQLSSSGDRPDLVMFPEYAAQVTIDSGTVIPVGACLAAGDLDTSAFQPSTLAAYATAGVQWGMPFNVSNPVLYYNKKVFAAAGLDPERPPRSLAELRDYSAQIVESGAASFGIALDSDTDGGGGWYLEQWFANAGELYTDNGNGRQAPATRVLYDGPAGVEMLSFVQSMVDDGLAAYVGDNPSGQDNLLKMADRGAPAAMALSTSAALGLILDVVAGGLIPDITADDLGVGPLPGPSGTPTALVGGAALYLVDGHGEQRVAATWDFIRYLTSPEIQSRWAAATGYVPVRSDALELEPIASTYRNDPRFKVAYDQLIGSPDNDALRGPILGPQQEVRVITARAVAAIMSGADVATSLSQAAAEANQAIADYNRRN